MTILVYATYSWTVSASNDHIRKLFEDAMHRYPICSGHMQDESCPRFFEWKNICEMILRLNLPVQCVHTTF